jgi:hypothetical protein
MGDGQMISVNVKHGLAIAVLAASLLVLPGEARSGMDERAVAKCVLDNMEGVNDKSAAALVYAACDTLYGTHQCKVDFSQFTDEEYEQIKSALKSGDISSLSDDLILRYDDEYTKAKDPKCRVPNS